MGDAEGQADAGRMSLSGLMLSGWLSSSPDKAKGRTQGIQSFRVRRPRVRFAYSGYIGLFNNDASFAKRCAPTFAHR